MKQKYKVYINNKAKIITENWNDFCSDYIIIEAAGGIVYNYKHELLIIFRNNKWDLPKGKVEIGESHEICAKREVQEETGVIGLEITERLQDTYHTYELNGKHILKKTNWYKMRTSFEGKLIPQIKEGITMAGWFNTKEITNKMKDSYGNIKELLKHE